MIVERSLLITRSGRTQELEGILNGKLVSCRLDNPYLPKRVIFSISLPDDVAASRKYQPLGAIRIRIVNKPLSAIILNKERAELFAMLPSYQTASEYETAHTGEPTDKFYVYLYDAKPLEPGDWRFLDLTEGLRQYNLPGDAKYNLVNPIKMFGSRGKLAYRCSSRRAPRAYWILWVRKTNPSYARITLEARNWLNSGALVQVLALTIPKSYELWVSSALCEEVIKGR